MTIYELSNILSNGGLDELFLRIYRKSDLERLRQRARYLNAAENFSKNYPNREDIHIFSSSANVRIGGNHVEKHGGNELSASVSTDIIAIVGYHDEAIIRLKMDKSEIIEIDLSDPTDIDSENEIMEIIRKNIESLVENEKNCYGFDAYISSDIPEKNIFSSSEILNNLFEKIISGNVKNSLNETDNSETGGIFEIDMKNRHKPVLHKINFDFSDSGYSLCIVDCGGEFYHESESDIDMQSVADAMEIDYLGQSDDDEFYDKLPIIRKKCTKRAIVSAICFFEENRLIRQQRDALNNGRLNEFFTYISESADSCALFHALYGADDCELSVRFYACKRVLNGSGAVRIDENGRIQAFVPNYMVNGFTDEIDRIFGQGSVYTIGIRNDGVIRIFG